MIEDSSAGTIPDHAAAMSVGAGGWWRIGLWVRCRSGRDEAGTIDRVLWLAQTDLAAIGLIDEPVRRIEAQAFRSIENCGALAFGMDANSDPTFRLLRAVLGQLKHDRPESWPGLRVLLGPLIERVTVVAISMATPIAGRGMTGVPVRFARCLARVCHFRFRRQRLSPNDIANDR